MPEALARNGFFGPNSFYMNHAANRAYAERAVNDGRLAMPVLFIGARYDYNLRDREPRHLGDPCAPLRRT